MTPALYKIVSELFHNYHKAFLTLDDEIRSEWYRITYAKL